MASQNPTLPTQTSAAAAAAPPAAAAAPTPNSGATIPASIAMQNTELVPSTRWKPSSLSSKIRIKKLSHVRYAHPSSTWDAALTFLQDFGMSIAKRIPAEGDSREMVWFAGYGVDEYVYYAERVPEGEAEKEFLGGVWEVERFEDLERAAELGNTHIVEMVDAPGGGHIVTLHDPEGFPVNFIHGATSRPSPTRAPSEPLQVNDEFSKPRKGAFQRFETGPAGVHKLGHFGLTIHDFEKMFEWYTTNFNLVPSDILYIPDGDGKKDVAAFLHVDRGEEWVDHHSFFISIAEKQHVHHSSFEVHDYDTQNMGHYWLKQKGYNPVWGVGRHRLGSQIFDYWWDPTGFMVEHYVDGDLVNEKTPTGRGLAGDESLAVWGPGVPGWFLD